MNNETQLERERAALERKKFQREGKKKTKIDI
jgi:hypothetical protein